MAAGPGRTGDNSSYSCSSISVRKFFLSSLKASIIMVVVQPAYRRTACWPETGSLSLIGAGREKLQSERVSGFRWWGGECW